MSDVSNFVRRNGSADRSEINKILSVINPLAFPEPEAEAVKERIILAPKVRKRTLTGLAGLDITKSSTATRDRFSSSITILPDTISPTAFPVSETLNGILTFNQEKYGAGATFTGSQYIEIPDDNQFDLTLPYFTVAFWFKANGVDQGSQIVWSKGSFGFDRDFCLACGNFDTDDYSTAPDTTTDPGLQIRLEANTDEDYCSACTDFDASFDTSSGVERVRVVISDGTNLVDETINASNLFDGNWHSIVIVSADSISDYCDACTDFDTDDYSVITNPVITIYMDKISLGTIDHSSVTGDLSNSANAFLGAGSSALTNPVKGSLALFEYQGTNWSTSDISAYHDDARIRVSNQKVAFHFIGNDSSVDTLDKVY
jgi:hypothetical protein